MKRSGITYRTLRHARSRILHMIKRTPGVHPSSYITPTAHVARDLAAEEWVYIGHHCALDPMTTIGRYTMLAPYVVVSGDDHIYDQVGVPTQFAGRPPQQVTAIGRDVWVGHSAFIRRGISIGNGAIVAAHAVVTRDVPAYSIVAGVPARQVADRFSTREEETAHERMLNGPVIKGAHATPLPLRSKSENRYGQPAPSA